jgi:hypothetical protein
MEVPFRRREKQSIMRGFPRTNNAMTTRIDQQLGRRSTGIYLIAPAHSRVKISVQTQVIADMGRRIV